MKKKFPGIHRTMENTTYDDWFERDRAHIALYALNGKVLMEFWDEAVAEIIEDGFIKFDRRDGNYHRSMVDYLNHLQGT